MAKNATGRDAKHGRLPTHRPFLVPIFVILNFFMFIITMFVNDCPQHSSSCTLRFLGRFSFQPVSENPLLGPSTSTLKKLGGLSADLVANEHQVWRLFTCLWLHAGLVHLLVNMFNLLIVGVQLERQYGAGRIGTIYLMSGIGGSLLAGIFVQHRVTAGASAPVFGLLGTMLSAFIINRSMHFHKPETVATVALVSAVNLAIGIMPHCDNVAHLGGLLFGFFLGCALLIRPQLDWDDQGIAPVGPKSSIKLSSRFALHQIALRIGAIVVLLISLCGVEFSRN